MRDDGPVSDGLLGLVEARLDGADAEAIAAFARAYLRRLDKGALTGRPGGETSAESVGAFRFASSRDGAPIAVRAFNPVPAEDGYGASGSVVETNTRDLPFLVDSVAAALRARGLEVRRVLHPIIGVLRGSDGRILRVVSPRETDARESVMHFE